MAKKVKLTKESEQKANEILAHHGYSSLDEMVENLISTEYDKIKTGGNKEEQAEQLKGLGYIS